MAFAQNETQQVNIEPLTLEFVFNEFFVFYPPLCSLDHETQHSVWLARLLLLLLQK